MLQAKASILSNAQATPVGPKVCVCVRARACVCVRARARVCACVCVCFTRAR